MDKREILDWLRETDPARLEGLWRRADAVRRAHLGDAVHLRALVEFSNRCARSCHYCGLRAENRALARYRMDADEILACARRAADLGHGTIVLQSGEDPALPAAWLAEVVRDIKARTPLAVTLSVGEKSEDHLALWRRAGADRYLLRFETSDRALYDRIHPPLGTARSDRIALLGVLQRLGYETGSGVMVGLPGQTCESLAADVALFGRLGLDMIGVGPFLPHPATPLGRPGARQVADQAPADGLMACKVVALARLVCPRANIPATSALSALDPGGGYERALAAGANVIMPNLTPAPYRALYEVYPGKAGGAAAEDGAPDGALVRRILAAGRRIGSGRGDAPSRSAGGERKLCGCVP